MSEIFNAPLNGLNLTPNQLITDKSYLSDCNNIVIDRAGIIQTRRGFANFLDSLTNAIKLFNFSGTPIIHDDIELKRENSGVWTTVTFPDTDEINSPDSETKIQSSIAANNFYFTGERVSSESGNPIDYKVKKLATPAGTVVNAGLEQPINCDYSLTLGGVLADNKAVAIRIFYVYTDANKNQIFSAPSDRIVVTNDSGSAKNITVRYQIPKQFNDRPCDIYYAISDESTVPATPSDYLYWSTQTLIVSQTMIDDGIFRTFDNFIMTSAIQNPIEFYTNATQETILQENSPPPKCVSIENYAGYTFYGNITGRLSQREIVAPIPLSTTCLTLDGIDYQRAATRDYSASPVQFTGDTIYDYVIDLCRAITATQTKYRAVYENSNLDFVRGWEEKTGDPTNSSKCTPAAVSGVRIFVFPRATGGGSTPDDTLSSYNTTSDAWEDWTDAPNQVCLGVLEEYSGKLYSLCGIDSAGTGAGETQIYDVASDSWTTGTLYPSGIRTQPSSAIYGDKIYVIGGRDSGGTALTATNYYDTTNDTWTTGLDLLPVAKYAGQSICVGNYIYYFGGCNNAGSPVVNSYKYDIIGDAWTNIENLPVATAYGGICHKDGIIYIINGDTNAEGSLDGRVNTYAYSIADDSFSSFESTNNPRYGNAAKVVSDYIYTLGGVDPSITTERYYIGGLYIQLQERFISDYTSISFTSGYISDTNFPNTSTHLERPQYTNQIAFSKNGLPEAVPVLNTIPVIGKQVVIQKLKALRSSLVIFTNYGAYSLNGSSPESFSVVQLDPTLILVAAESVAYLENMIFALTTKGIVKIDESGAHLPPMSYPIKSELDIDVSAVALKNRDINGTANEYEYRYVLSVNDKTYQYNNVTDQWTFWQKDIDDISSWMTIGGYLYYTRPTQASKQRKDFADTDYQDESTPIESFFELIGNQFNNFGTLKIFMYYVLNQLGVSDLIITQLINTNFYNGENLTYTFDSEYKKIQVPLEARRAIEYKLKFSWDSQKENLDYAPLLVQGIAYTFDTVGINIK